MFFVSGSVWSSCKTKTIHIFWPVLRIMNSSFVHVSFLEVNAMQNQKDRTLERAASRNLRNWRRPPPFSRRYLKYPAPAIAKTKCTVSRQAPGGQGLAALALLDPHASVCSLIFRLQFVTAPAVCNSPVHHSPIMSSSAAEAMM